MKTITLDKGIAEIKNPKCVNSNWKASFLTANNEKYCQCSFGGCKVEVLITYNGHEPYRYILTESEINSLPIMLKDNK